MQKTASENSQYSKKDMFSKIGKIGDNAWALAFAKCSVWVKNEKSKNGVKNDSRSTLELFCAKNGFREQLIFEK